MHFMVVRCFRLLCSPKRFGCGTGEKCVHAGPVARWPKKAFQEVVSRYKRFFFLSCRDRYVHHLSAFHCNNGFRCVDEERRQEVEQRRQRCVGWWCSQTHAGTGQSLVQSRSCSCPLTVFRCILECLLFDGCGEEKHQGSQNCLIWSWWDAWSLQNTI